jgi:outer membrane protein with beta-barrel domain
MRKLTLAALVFSVLASVARAQEAPVADVAVGYGFIEVPQGFTFMMHGGSVAAAYNVNDWLGIVGDFGAYHAHPGVSLTAETYTFGPRFSYRAFDRFTPFAQLLLGGQHASAVTTGFTDASNAFTIGAGGGFDVGLDGRGRFAVRSQIEYFGFHANGTTTTTARLSIGIVFRIGRKG